MLWSDSFWGAGRGQIDAQGRLAGQHARLHRGGSIFTALMFHCIDMIAALCMGLVKATVVRSSAAVSHAPAALHASRQDA